MSKILISYFSASGITKKVALKLSTIIDGDLFEIEPVTKYTKEDLDWTNKKSRSSMEMSDISSRPAILKKVNNINEYDKVIIGFPVWWYKAPTIINTFIEENDLTNKQIYIFVTSGSSSQSSSFENLKKSYPNLQFISAARFQENDSDSTLKLWLDSIN